MYSIFHARASEKVPGTASNPTGSGNLSTIQDNPKMEPMINTAMKRAMACNLPTEEEEELFPVALYSAAEALLEEEEEEVDGREDDDFAAAGLLRRLSDILCYCCLTEC